MVIAICCQKRFDIEWSSCAVKTKRKSSQQEKLKTTGDDFTEIKAVALHLVYHRCCNSQTRHPSALPKHDCTRYIHFGFSSLMFSEENLSPPCQLNVDTDLCWIKEKRCWRCLKKSFECVENAVARRKLAKKNSTFLAVNKSFEVQLLFLKKRQVHFTPRIETAGALANYFDSIYLDFEGKSVNFLKKAVVCCK